MVTSGGFEQTTLHYSDFKQHLLPQDQTIYVVIKLIN